MKHPLLLVLVVTTVLFPTFGLSAPALGSSQNPQALDRMPEPVGGLTAIMQLVSYPESAMQNGIEGKVVLSIVVDTAGQVKSIKVLESARNDLDKSAVKAIEQSQWIPAQKDGKPVEAGVIVPIQFKLDKKSKK